MKTTAGCSLSLRFLISFGFLCCSFLANSPVLANAESQLTVSVKDQRLTLLCHDASLFSIIERLAQAMSLTSHIGPGVEETRLSFRLQNVSLQQGLDHVLAKTNYMLTEKHLYVWSRNASNNTGSWREIPLSSPVPSPNPAHEVPLTHEGLKREALYSPDVEDRLSALETLGNRENETDLMPTLAKALEDHNPAVRGMAIEMLGETEGPIPIDALAEIIRQDPFPENRLEAIGVLASRDPQGAELLLEEAFSENDPEIADFAKSIIEDAELFYVSEALQD